MSSASVQLCRLDLASFFPAVPAPLPSPSGDVCGQSESGLLTISQVTICNSRCAKSLKNVVRRPNIFIQHITVVKSNWSISHTMHIISHKLYFDQETGRFKSLIVSHHHEVPSKWCYNSTAIPNLKSNSAHKSV